MSNYEEPISDDPVETSVAAYTSHAAEYAAMNAEKMAATAERFAASLSVPSLILDAGCGPGRDLARFVSFGHVARGVDLNPAFVAMANTQAPTSQTDLRQLGDRFPPGTFDGIWASASLVHLGETETIKVLGHFGWLLRPGGKLYVCVKMIGESGWLDEPDGRRWYTVWGAREFAEAVADAGFDIDRVDEGEFVGVWASRKQ